MQPLAGYNQIEPLTGAALKADVDSVWSVAQRGDRVAEAVFYLRADEIEELRGQRATRQFHVPTPAAKREILRVDAGNLPALRIHECDLAGGHMLGPDSRQDFHPIDDVDGRTPDVDRIAAGPDSRGALDEGHVETIPDQPVGQGWAGDARAR
jgi:hypothetical protein